MIRFNLREVFLLITVFLVELALIRWIQLMDDNAEKVKTQWRQQHGH